MEFVGTNKSTVKNVKKVVNTRKLFRVKTYLTYFKPFRIETYSVRTLAFY